MSHLAVETKELGRTFFPRSRFLGGRQGEEAVALRDVTIHVSAGERIALIGPNGAGKSTLLRVLATLLTPTSGSALVAGYDVQRDRRRVRAAVGLMSGDDRSFFWPLNAMENLSFFAALHDMHGREATHRATVLLDEVDLDPTDRRPVSAYSSGMRQRLSLARTLLHDPAILLLDEPTANLDRDSRERLVSTLKSLSDGPNRTVLFATHDVELVQALAHRSLTLVDGQLSDESRDRQSRRYRLIVRSAGRIGDDLAEAAGESVVVEDLGDGHALAAAIQRVLAEGGEVLAVEAASAAETTS